jgi:hypothetical protein
MATDLPPHKAVKDLLEGLLGRDVNIAPGEPVSPVDSAAFGVYVDDALKMSAVVSLDLRLAAFLGTSIALIPKGGAQAAIEDRYISETIFENVGEVLNVFAGVLNESGDIHQRLYSTVRGSTAAPPDAAALAAATGRRLDLTVEIDQYGAGAISCILA